MRAAGIAIVFSTVFAMGIPDLAFSARDPGCTYFGHTFCLRLHPGASVNFRFGPDFFVHSVFAEESQFGIYEGDYPSIDREKCLPSSSAGSGRTVEACSYADGEKLNFIFWVNKEDLDLELPTLLHVWFPSSTKRDDALQILKMYLVIANRD